MPTARIRAAATRGGVRIRLLLGLSVVAAVLALAWMLFLPNIMAAAVARRTNFPVGIDGLFANVFTGRIDLRGLTMENPAVFAPREFVQVRRFQADAQLFTLLADRVVLDEVVLDVPLLVLVTNTDGTMNLDLFRERLAGAAVPAPRGSSRAFLIKRLQVRVGEVRLINLAARQPRMRTMQLDFEQTFTHVSEWSDLLVPELLRRVAVAGGAFEGLVPEDLGRVLGGWSRSAGGLLQEPSRRATDTLKSLFEKLEENRKP